MIHRKCRDIDRSLFSEHPVLKKHGSLLNLIKKSFYPDDTIWFIKAPGRVNLIGEHTDYNMGPVLPCAIDREIVLCLRKSHSPEIHLSNISPVFEEINFSLDQPIQPYPRGNWGNYIKAGVKGILDYLGQSGSHKQEIQGFEAIVSSTLPLAAGISSSSAMVVAAALSLVIVNKIELDKLKIAEICAKAEHFVGTAGGGMDQTASLMGKKDAFLRIEFNPLKVQIIPAPTEITLILFHSLVEAEKSQSARKEYNRRVLECQMGVELINQFLEHQSDQKFQRIQYIGNIEGDYFHLGNKKLNTIVNKFINQLKKSYKLDELLTLFNLSQKELAEKYHYILRGDALSEPADGFKIKGRFQHVYSECQRVDKMINCLQNSDISMMGYLLDESHKSLSQDYEVSTPEVDSLVKRLKYLDVHGARLMGAGFGGMILALSDSSKKDALIANMKETFYRKKSIDKIDNYIIPCVTSDGADAI